MNNIEKDMVIKYPNRIIFDDLGNIICSTPEGTATGDVVPYRELQSIDYIDIPYGSIDYSTHYIESIDVDTKQPVIKEYPKQELTPEQARIKELEEQLAWAQSQIVSTIPELSK